MKIDFELQDEILEFEMRSGTAYGGHIIHLWIDNPLRALKRTETAYRPVCGKQYVYGYDGVMIGRNICKKCLSIARKKKKENTK